MKSILKVFRAIAAHMPGFLVTLQMVNQWSVRDVNLLTGTLQETEANKYVIRGILGPATRFVTTKDLMDRGIISKLSVYCHVLRYPEHDRKSATKFKYQDEVDFIVHHDKRNEFIAKLAASTKDSRNTLILTDYHNKKKHIQLIAEKIKKFNPEKKIFIVTGNVDADERERIRQETEKGENIIIIATFGTFSTGINIKNLQYIIFATNSKSMIKLLQSIGRGLRLDGKDNVVKVFDIVDDFSYNRKVNYLAKHFFERIKIYTSEKFSYRITNINM